MAKLMVSVRSVADAFIAVHNDVDVVDVKEPLRGALGMVDRDTASAIVREVPPRIPVGLALGEWREWRARPDELPLVPPGISYLKVGLSGLADEPHAWWRQEFRQWRERVESRLESGQRTKWVAVLYADWQAADAPRPEIVLDLARDGFGAILVDTFGKSCRRAKSGHPEDHLGGLFHCLERRAIENIILYARTHGLEVALSGSLRERGVLHAAVLGADIVGVRAAVCQDGQRDGCLDAAKVRRVLDLLRGRAAAAED